MTLRPLTISKNITYRDTVSFDIYLKTINQFKVLTREEEQELCESVSKGEQWAIDKLVKHNLKFVVSVAKQYVKPGLNLEDLVNEGNIGLIKAIDNFDPNRKLKFISFAVWWIRTYIQGYIQVEINPVRLPCNKSSKLHKIYKLIEQYEKEQKNVDIDEICDSLKMSKKEKEDMKTILSHKYVSINNPIKDDETSTVEDLLGSEDDSINKAEIKEFISKMLNCLDEREKIVVAGVHGINLPFEKSHQQIGEELGLTKERIRQIYDKSIIMLKSKFANNEDYNDIY